MLTAGCPDELPNPHKDCVREILKQLVCQEHDFRRLSVELRNMQKEFKTEMEKIEFQCHSLRRPVCDEEKHGTKEKKVPRFTQQIASIDVMNECYTLRIAELRKERDQLAADAQQCLLQLSAEKCNMKRFHENTIDHLKRTAINANDPVVVKNCEKDICEMHKRFVGEVAFVKRCEHDLQAFLVQLKNEEYENFCRCCCFQEYDWLPLGKSFKVVDEIGDKIKETMGATLREAFAQAHLLQPTDMKSFLSAYLMNLENNEKRLQKKLRLFGNVE